MRAVGAATALAIAVWLATGLGGGHGAGSDQSVARTTPAPQAPRVRAGRTPVARPRAAAGELVIAPRGDAAAVTAAVAEVGGSIAWTSPRSGLVLVRFANAHDAQAARAVLAHDRRIASVALNRTMRGAGIATSPRALQAWAVHAMQLPTRAPDQSGVVVALLDSGVAYEDYDDGALTYARASDLANTPFADGWDFVNDDAHPNDDHGHGTQLADLIAGTGEIASPGAGATILPIKVLDQNNEGTELSLAEGIRYAVDHGAAVINMSLSFPAGYFPSAYLQDAIDYADAAGVVMIAAAGNQGADGVTYPAAFREVIAVGAAKLAPVYRSPKTDPWQYAESYLERAAYSNLGDKVEIVAPAGDFDGDADGNGLPEGSVAQSPVAGNPAQIEYVIGAGTSQASALVAGTAAAMLGQNRALTPHQIRSILGEGARAQVGGATLSPDVGRGYLDVATAIESATREEADVRPRFAVGLRVAMVAGDAGRIARATAEVIDAAGQPAAGMVVYGGYSGSATGRATGITDAAGVVTFDAPVTGDAAVVAFQVDAVADALVAPTVFERPRGAVHIDSCSLELMSTYASGAGIATSPQGATAGEGIATSPVNATGDVDAGTDDGIATSPISGQGIATSPIVSGEGIATSPANGIATSPTTGQGIATSPIALRGPQLAGELPSYTLVNYSWRGATVPIAVAVDAAWFDTAFPDASIVTSEGAGIATSPIRLNPATAFKVAVSAVATDPAACQPLIVRTFLGGLDATPLQPTACTDLADCDLRRAELAEIADWASSGQGIATSPVWTPTRAMTQAQFAQALTAVTAWTSFAKSNASSPPAALGEVLEAAVLGAGAPAGAATSCPMPVPADDDPRADQDAGFDVGSPAP